VTAVGVHSPCSHLFGVVNAVVSPVSQTGGRPRTLSIEISRFLVEQLEAVEIAIANDRSIWAASYRQTDFSRVYSMDGWMPSFTLTSRTKAICRLPTTIYLPLYLYCT
jgi:hypothetical protein